MTDRETPMACTKVDPGICGFPCIVKAQKKGARAVSIEISGSECEQIKKLSGLLEDMSLVDLFKPINPKSRYGFSAEIRMSYILYHSAGNIKNSGSGNGNGAAQGCKIRGID